MFPAHVAPTPAGCAGWDWHSSSFLLGILPLRPLAAGAVGSVPAGPGQGKLCTGRKVRPASRNQAQKQREEEKSKTHRKPSNPNSSTGLGNRYESFISS